MSKHTTIDLPLEDGFTGNLIQLADGELDLAELINGLGYKGLKTKDGKPGPGKYEMSVAAQRHGQRIIEVNQLLDGEGHNKDRIANMILTEDNGDVMVQVLPRYKHAGLILVLEVSQVNDK